MRAFFLLLVLCSSCGVMQEHDAGIDAGRIECTGFDRDRCIAVGCRAISGYRSEGPGTQPSGPPVYAGCRYTAGYLPGAAITCAFAPDGVCWLFTDTDVPGDFRGTTLQCNSAAPDFCPKY